MIVCTYCGSQNHPTSHCPKTHQGSANRANLFCSYCGSNKHNRAGCPKAWPRANPVVLKD